MLASIVVVGACLLLVAYAVGKRASWRTSIVVTAAGALVVPLTAMAAPVASAATRPAVLAVHASPSSLPNAGGAVTVFGKVNGAMTCHLAVLGDHGVKVALPKPSNCADGSYKAQVGLGPDLGQPPVVVKLGLFAGSSAPGPFYVVVAGTPAHPAILSARANPWELPAAGGWTTVDGKVRNARTCHLEALGWKHPTLPSQGCASGTFTEKLWLSPNEKHVAEPEAFELVATGGGTAVGKFFVRLAAAPLPPPTTTTTTAAPVTTTTSPPIVVSSPPPAYIPPPPVVTPPATTTTVPPTTTTSSTTTTTVPPTTTTSSTTTTTVAPTTTTSSTTTSSSTTTTVPPTTTTTAVNPNQYVQAETSVNWSGYVMTGSQPYTYVQGTFTVPSLTTSETCNSVAAEWVGVDGMSGTSGANDLIQAGVDETSTDPATGTCGAPNTFYTAIWWEILPQYQTMILPEYWDNGEPVGFLGGDQITVTIGQVGDSACTSLPSGDTCWGIEVEDDTTGDTFVTDQPYGGPGSSAEWIVEDPGQPDNSSCTVNPSPPPYECNMPDYTPAVQFTGLGATPSTYTNLYSETLVQNGSAVSTPSSLADNYDFTVSYTGGSQAAPEGSENRLPITSYPLGTPVAVGHGGVPARPFPTKG